MLLEATKLTKIFSVGDSRLYVLKDMNFHVSPGEKVAIIGPSGSGKSTLLNLLSGLDTPDAGTIRYCGKAYDTYSKSAFSRLRLTEFGYIFQAFHLLSELNVFDNILLPLSARQERSKDAANAVKSICGALGLSERLYHYPHQLSGGEQQRVAIARALIGKPSILFSDEATGNLDAANSRQVMELLTQCCADQKVALVFVTHDMSLVPFADRVVNLGDSI